MWAWYVQEAWDFAVDQCERLEVQVKLDPVTNAGKGFEPRGCWCLQWFCHAAGHCVEDGPHGFDAHQPETSQCDGDDDVAWARFFFVEGGCGQAVQVDAEGWSALMHAMQAAVHRG